MFSLIPVSEKRVKGFSPASFRIRGGECYDEAMSVYFTCFDTAIGRCAIAWGPRGIVGVQLPEASHRETRDRVLQRFAGAREAPSSPGVERARDNIVALLRGEASDLSAIVLDMECVPPFHRRVYAVARSIPRGETLTYGDIAMRVGVAGSARAVGQALGRNPFAIIVPCHRVVAAGGRIGGFSANGGTTTKLRLLSIEGHENGALGLFDDFALAKTSRRLRA